MALFFQNKSKIENGMSKGERIFTDMQLNTSEIMRNLFSSNDLFYAFAGSVFALHQDTLKKYEIDMHRIMEVYTWEALDEVHPHPLGRFKDRVDVAFKSLLQIDDLNLEFIEKGRPQNIDEPYKAHAMMARMRSTAARVWILTIQSKLTQSAILQTGVFSMWLMLLAVPRERVCDSAKIFVGSYFTDVCTECVNADHWPHRY